MNPSMTGGNADIDWTQPNSRSSHTPDDRLSGSGEDEPLRHGLGINRTRYPDNSMDTPSECRSCGAAIFSVQPTCRYCLANHISDPQAGWDVRSQPEPLLHVVHLGVAATAHDGAGAPGRAGTTQLGAPDNDQAADARPLVDEGHPELPIVQTDRWLVLPAGVRTAWEFGVQLLATYRDRVTSTDRHRPKQPWKTPAARSHGRGREIGHQSQLDALPDSVGNCGGRFVQSPSNTRLLTVGQQSWTAAVRRVRKSSVGTACIRPTRYPVPADQFPRRGWPTSRSGSAGCVGLLNGGRVPRRLWR